MEMMPDKRFRTQSLTWRGMKLVRTQMCSRRSRCYKQLLGQHIVNGATTTASESRPAPSLFQDDVEMADGASQVTLPQSPSAAASASGTAE
eukprot:7739252-Pyramimonas_sp.AAC.1